MEKIYYGKAVYNNKEINAVIKVLKKNSLNLIDGPSVKLLEKKVARIFGKRFGLMVNSGSSANLLALSSLNIKKGSEIITPSLTFSTTIAPIYQLGLIANFIDVEKNTFIANINQIEKKINNKTAAILIPNLLGNIPDWKKIKEIANKYKLYLIEDSADTIGYSLNKKNTGKLSDIVTTSFYASHVVTGAGFGGMVCFNNENFYNEAKLLRGWGRSSAIFNESEKITKRFSVKISGIDYDKKYIFSKMGYNFLPSEISAAFAIEQLKKLKLNIKKRISNFNNLRNFFIKFSELLEMPILNKNIYTGWLAFPMIIKNNKFFDRTMMQIYFERKNIQTRTIFTGNILKQPVMKKINYKSNPQSSIISTNIMKNGVLLGCHQGMKKTEINYIKNTFLGFLKKTKARVQ
jgi:CDP-4-dehydro-6-deoxyglucose reductase, E1